MEYVQKALAFIVCLGVLIAVHEYGHFWVARRNGIKVLKFSIGFGKPLFSWKDKYDTQFIVAAIPLGGYVKMVGEPGSEVDPALASQSFANKKVSQRFAVVAAGPVVNLLFAVLLYWGLFMSGMTGTVPLIGDINENTPAARAGMMKGDEVTAIDGEATTTWESVALALVDRIGDSGTIKVTVNTADSNISKDYVLNVDGFMSGQEKENPVEVLGIERYFPKVPVILGEIAEDKAGARQGLQTNDQVQTVNGQPIDDWRQWVEVIRANAETPIQLTLLRKGELLTLSVTPDSVTDDKGQRFGQLGVAPSEAAVTLPPELVRTYNYAPHEALVQSVKHTWSLMGLTVKTLWKMVKGEISLETLSGPITIARLAGESVSYGLETFVSFVAYLSISLGVLNLLPIPVLDGGHLMFYLVEWLKGSPVPERVQHIGNSIGLGLLMMFMGLALYNDVLSF